MSEHEVDVLIVRVGDDTSDRAEYEALQAPQVEAYDERGQAGGTHAECMAAAQEIPLETLESCTCGECFYCPDGYHGNQATPCSCTADCALAEEDEDFDQYDFDMSQGLAYEG